MNKLAFLVLIGFLITGCAPPLELEPIPDETRPENLLGEIEDLQSVTIVTDTSELPDNCEYRETIEITITDARRSTYVEEVPIIPLASIDVDTNVNPVVVQPDMFLSDGLGEGKAYSCR